MLKRGDFAGKSAETFPITGVRRGPAERILLVGLGPKAGFGRKPYVMGVSARGSFKRSAYGMNYAVANGWVGDTVDLIIEFEAVRQ